MRDYLGNLRADYVGWNHCPAAGLDYIDRAVLHPDNRVVVQNIRLPDMNDDQWWFLVKAVLHLSHQVSRVEQKVSLLLSQQDFSKEDSAVLGMTKTVEEAIGRIPPRVPPATS